MADKTGIEWTDATWNPTTGCDQVSPGCDNCYALTLASRLKAMGSARYQNDGDPRTSGPGFAATMHPDALDQPLRWTRPRRIFVNSMSDLFHDAITDLFIADVFAVMASCPQHTFQVLTKRHARMRSLLDSDDFQALYAYRLGLLVGDRDRRKLKTHLAQPSVWPLANVWLGVSVENQKWADIRIPALLDTPAAVRFLSCEPLLGSVDLSYFYMGDAADSNYQAIGLEKPPTVDWVIVGGESGPGARPMHPDWVRTIRDQCQADNVPFLFKQHGAWAPRGRLIDGQPLPVDNDRTLLLNVHGNTRGRAAGSLTNQLCTFSDGSADEVMELVGKHKAGRILDGRTWDEYPVGV